MVSIITSFIKYSFYSTVLAVGLACFVAYNTNPSKGMLLRQLGIPSTISVIDDAIANNITDYKNYTVCSTARLGKITYFGVFNHLIGPNE